MIGDFFKRLIDGFKFTIKDMLVLIVITVFLIGGYNIYSLTENTNSKINSMEQRYYSDIEDNGFTVLVSLQNNDVIETKDIIAFLENKPAGRSDLKKALQNEIIYERLVNIFDGLAKNCKKALIY